MCTAKVSLNVKVSHALHVRSTWHPCRGLLTVRVSSAVGGLTSHGEGVPRSDVPGLGSTGSADAKIPSTQVSGDLEVANQFNIDIRDIDQHLGSRLIDCKFRERHDLPGSKIQQRN